MPHPEPDPDASNRLNSAKSFTACLAFARMTRIVTLDYRANKQRTSRMRKSVFPINALLPPLLFILLFGMNSHASTPGELVERMKGGGHVLFIRHAYAPGSGDPSHFKIGDCETQRNLDARGRNQARQIGRWLRSRGIAGAAVYSSQWCRCLETAALLEMGPVKELTALNSFFQRPQDREPNLSSLRAFLRRQPLEGQLIIMVTHYVTIAGITGKAVGSGHGVLVELAGKGDYRVRGEWVGPGMGFCRTLFKSQWAEAFGRASLKR